MEHLIFEIVSWMQMDNKENLPEQSEFVLDVMEELLVQEKYDALAQRVFLLPSLALHMVKYGYSPGRVINLTNKILDKNPDLVQTWDIALVILDKVKNAM